MTQTTLPDQKTIKIISDNCRIISDQDKIPPNVVVMPMTVLEKPEKIGKRRRKR